MKINYGKCHHRNRSELFQAQADGLQNITARELSCVPLAQQNHPTRPVDRKSELHYLLEQIEKGIVQQLIDFAQPRIDVANQSGDRSTRIPQVHRKQVLQWICSEFSYSNSSANSYRIFREELPCKKASLGLNRFHQCRTFLASHLQRGDMEILNSMFKDNFRSIYVCGPEIAIDELLAGWESEISGVPH